MSKQSDFFIQENLDIIKDRDYLEFMRLKEIDEGWQQADFEAKSFQPLTFFGRGLKKSEIKELAVNAVENVLLNGNPLQIAEALNAMLEFIDQVKHDKRFSEYVREEASKSPKGFISKSGARIEIAETGHSYDYSKCGDQQLLSLESLLKECTDAVKVRKDFLKTVPAAGVLITDEMTGETNNIFPPIKTSNSSYRITLAK